MFIQLFGEFSSGLIYNLCLWALNHSQRTNWVLLLFYCYRQIVHVMSVVLPKRSAKTVLVRRMGSFNVSETLQTFYWICYLQVWEHDSDSQQTHRVMARRAFGHQACAEEGFTVRLTYCPVAIVLPVRRTKQLRVSPFIPAAVSSLPSLPN